MKWLLKGMITKKLNGTALDAIRPGRRTDCNTPEFQTKTRSPEVAGRALRRISPWTSPTHTTV